MGRWAGTGYALKRERERQIQIESAGERTARVLQRQELQAKLRQAIAARRSKKKPQQEEQYVWQLTHVFDAEAVLPCHATDGTTVRDCACARCGADVAVKSESGSPQ